jgi:hypothetical protein
MIRKLLLILCLLTAPQVWAVSAGAWLDGAKMRLPGTAANYASTPDSTVLSITGDIDIRVKVAATDWTPASNSNLVSKRPTNANNNSIAYTFYLSSGATLRFGWSTDGTSGTSTEKNSTVATGLTDGSIKWVRVTVDVDNGAGGADIKFYMGDDGVSWTQLGTTVTNAGTISYFDNASALGIGGMSNGDRPFTGSIYYAEIRNNILDNGTGIVFQANFAQKNKAGKSTFTESSSNAATVTVNSTDSTSFFSGTLTQNGSTVHAGDTLSGTRTNVTPTSGYLWDGTNTAALTSFATGTGTYTSICPTGTLQAWDVYISDGTYEPFVGTVTLAASGFPEIVRRGRLKPNGPAPSFSSPGLLKP